MEITLDQLLKARDDRYARQLALTREWPDRTLVCLTVVLPGPVKRDDRSLKVAEAAVAAVQEMLRPEVHELYDLDGKGVWERTDTCICMAESLCCVPETVTLSISYTPI